jgi:hypothetical protein
MSASTSDAERVSLAGHNAERLVASTERALHRLQTTPPSIEDVLLGTVARHVGAIDFSALTASIRHCETLTKAGDVTFTMRNEVHSLESWIERLREVRNHAEPFRQFLAKPR